MNPAVKTDIRALEAAARAWKAQGKTYRGKDAQEMREVHAEDAQGLMAVHAAVVAEDWDYAWKLARGLDTIVRDQIPSRLYYFLMRKGEEKRA